MIYIINGPNLNLLGKREPQIYGQQSLIELNAWISRQREHCNFRFLQSNSEGQIIDFLHEAGELAQGVVINPGGYTHTSVAIHDAIKAISPPVVEVHLSQIFARESFRQESITARAAHALISGLGGRGYLAAVDFILSCSFESSSLQDDESDLAAKPL
jgi:3-dehydroquinate dehydratase II